MNQFRRNFVLVGVLSLLVMVAYDQMQDGKLADVQSQVGQVIADISGQTFRERVVELPEDNGAWYTTLVYRDQTADPASRRLASMMASTPRLQSLSAQTKTFVYTPDDPLYSSRFSQFFGGRLPAISIQDAAGNVVYKASGANLPSDGESLADEIAHQIDHHIEGCIDCRPRPKPKPTPTPNVPAVVPDIRPSEPQKPAGSELPILAILIPFLAGAAGLMQEWRRSNA